MRVLHRCYHVAALVLIALPARGQHAEDFDRESVLAQWNSISANVKSGRVEFVKEYFLSRNGAPLKLRQRESVRRSYNGNGSAFFYSVEEYGEKPLSQNSLKIANEKYGASLHKPSRCGVSKCMRGDSRTKACKPHGTLERRFDRGNGPSVVLDEMLRLWINPVPAP